MKLLFQSIHSKTSRDTAKTFGLSTGIDLTEDRFGPDFADIKRDYTQEFYQSYWSFISQCLRTGKFRSVYLNGYIWEWINNLIPHFMKQVKNVITLGLKLMSVKGALGLTSLCRYTHWIDFSPEMSAVIGITVENVMRCWCYFWPWESWDTIWLM